MSANGKKYSKTWTSDSCAFDVPNGLYDITVTKGGMVYKAEKVPVVGITIHEVPLTTLKVEYPGVKDVNMTAISVGSSSVTTKTWTSNGTEFVLFRGGTYDLKVQKGGMVHTASVPCNKETVTYSVPLSKLTVKFPGIKTEKITVSVGSSSVTTSTWNVDEAVYILFKGLTYNLRLEKGGMVHTAEVSCNDGEVVYRVPLTKLTVKFPGIKTERITVSTGSSTVITSDWNIDEAVFILFKDMTYNLKLEKGSMVHEGSISCDEDEETYDVPVCHVTVRFNGKASEASIGINGTNVITYTWKENLVDFYVFKDTGYFVTIKIGNNIYSCDNIDCNDDNINVEI